MYLFLEFILFCILVAVSFYLPGIAIISLLARDTHNSENYLLRWASGIAIFILGNYFFASLHLTYAYLLIVICVCIYVFWQRKNISFFPKNKLDKIAFFLILMGSFAFALLSATSGIFTKNGTQFMGLNAFDGITHLSYIKNQIIYFPPQHPELAGVPLRGYHYFYDFLLSRFVLFFHFSPEDLLFRFFPFFISVFYGLSFYNLSKKITDNVYSQRILLFMVYFGSGFSSFIAFFKHNFNPLTAQPIDIILDPSMVLAIALLVVAIAYLPNIKKSLGYVVLIGIFLGIIAQIKVYVGLTGIGMLLIYVLTQTIKSSWKERVKLFATVGLVCMLTAVTFLPNNANSGRFIFAPFNFYDQFMQQPVFSFTHWGLIEAIYRDHHNIPRLVLMTIESIIVFWILNLGLRLIFLIKLRKLVSKDFWQNQYNLLIVGVIIFTAAFPSFFLQSPSPFEVMQFTWITLVFLSIPTGIIIGDFMKGAGKMGKSLAFVAILLLSLPYTFALEAHYLSSKDSLALHVQVFQSLGEKISPTKFYIVLPDRLTYPTKAGVVDELLWYPAPLTTALTGRSTYYEGNATPFARTQLQKDREKQIFDLSDSLKSCDVGKTEKLLTIVGSKYVLTYYPQPCWSTSSAILIKNETEKYSYYQFR